jgi:hypothetical protein
MYSIKKIREKIENVKEVYREDDERFNPDSEDGEVKDHIDSEWNECLDYLLEKVFINKK